MQRIHTMSVVPDLLPELHPSVDLRVNFPEAPPQDIKRRTREKRKYEKVDAGVFLLPEQVRHPVPHFVTTISHLLRLANNPPCTLRPSTRSHASIH